MARTVINEGENHIGSIGGALTRVSATFTRPANVDAYAVGDVVSNSVSATVPMTLTDALRVAGGSGWIVRARLETNKKSIVPRFRVHLYNALDPTVSVDNAAWQDKYADAAKRVCQFDLPAMTTGADATNSDMSRAHDSGLRIPVVAAAASRNLFAVLETLDIFTPDSGQSFTLILWLDNN